GVWEVAAGTRASFCTRLIRHANFSDSDEFPPQCLCYHGTSRLSGATAGSVHAKRLAGRLRFSGGRAKCDGSPIHPDTPTSPTTRGQRSRGSNTEISRRTRLYRGRSVRAVGNDLHAAW